MNLDKLSATAVLLSRLASSFGAAYMIGGAVLLTASPVHAEVFFNSAPVAQAGGVYSIHLGESLVVDGSGSSDPDMALGIGEFISDYRWDIGANGSFEGFGVTDTFSATELINAGVASVGVYALRLRVVDSFGGVGVQDTQIEVLAPVDVTHAVPEPGSLALLGLGVAGIYSVRRHQRE